MCRHQNLASSSSPRTLRSLRMAQQVRLCMHVSHEWDVAVLEVIDATFCLLHAVWPQCYLQYGSDWHGCARRMRMRCAEALRVADHVKEA